MSKCLVFLLWLGPNHIPSVLLLLISRPEHFWNAYSNLNRFSADLRSETKTVVTSAYCETLNSLLNNLIPLIVLSCPIALVNVAFNSFKSLLHFWAWAYSIGQHFEAIVTSRHDEGCEWSWAFRQLYLPKSRVCIQLCEVLCTCELSQGDEGVILTLNIVVELCQVRPHSDFTLWLGGHYHWGTPICWVVHWRYYSTLQHSCIFILGFIVKWHGDFSWNCECKG